MERGYNIPNRQLGEARKKIKFNPEVLKSREISEFDTQLAEINSKPPASKSTNSNELEFSIGIEQEKKRNRELMANLLQTVTETKPQEPP